MNCYKFSCRLPKMAKSFCCVGQFFMWQSQQVWWIASRSHLHKVSDCNELNHHDAIAVFIYFFRGNGLPEEEALSFVFGNIPTTMFQITKTKGGIYMTSFVLSVVFSFFFVPSLIHNLIVFGVAIVGRWLNTKYPKGEDKNRSISSRLKHRWAISKYFFFLLSAT